jgi:hypothetical protein
MKVTNEQAVGRDVARNFRQLSTELAADLAVITSDAAALDARVIALEDSGWTGVTFSNSWVDHGAPNQNAQYSKAGDVVRVRGVIKNGTLNTVAFVLPSGFRPPSTLRFSSPEGIITVDSSGNVSVFGAGNTIFGVTFSFYTSS